MIALIVPSRGRPERARGMVSSAREMAREPVRIVVVVDDDDPLREQYEAALPAEVVVRPRVGYAGALNAAASALWDDYSILGAFGDDVLFRTPAWDTAVYEALATPGIAYGNDLVHAAGHPTVIWMSSVIAKALGWLALPASWHLWVDDAWKALGQETGTLRYLPDVIVEHMHPAVGKAEMDATYHSVYDGERAHQDHLGFLGWQERDLASDAAKVRAVIGA